MSALLVLAGLGMVTAHAQSTQDGGNCPQLPADAGLAWEYKATGGSDFCRALRADGSEAFGLYISRKANFEPKRGNRAEAGVIDGLSIYWYRGELATTNGSHMAFYDDQPTYFAKLTAFLRKLPLISASEKKRRGAE